MNRQPLLSIVIPVYNVEKYLRAALESVVSQDFQDGELEVIIINDGSTDVSKIIAQEYVDRFGFVSLITTDNSGLGAARNFGVKHANGRYVLFFDSDDLLVDGLIGSILEKINTAPDVDVFVFDYADFGITAVEAQTAHLFDLSKYKYGNVAWNKVYQMDFWRMHQFEYPEGVKYEDTPLTHLIMGLSRKTRKIEMVGYLYRQNRMGSITADKNSDDLHYRLNALEILQDNITKYSEELIVNGTKNVVITKFLKEILLLFITQFRKQHFVAQRDLFQFEALIKSDLIKPKIVFNAGLRVTITFLWVKIMMKLEEKK